MQITQFDFCHSDQLISDSIFFFNDLHLQSIENISAKTSA